MGSGSSPSRSADRPSAQALIRSHTNSIAGDDETYDAFLDQCGVIRVPDFDDLLELAALYAAYPDPPPAPGAVVMTTSGGEAALVADLAASGGLELPPLPARTRRRLQQTLGTFSLPHNPLDAWGSGWDTERFRTAMTEIATATGIPTIIAGLDAPASGGGDAHIAREVVRIFADLRALTGRYFVILNTTAASGTDPGVAELATQLGIPCVSGLTGGPGDDRALGQASADAGLDTAPRRSARRGRHAARSDRGR